MAPCSCAGSAVEWPACQLLGALGRPRGRNATVPVFSTLASLSHKTLSKYRPHVGGSERFRDLSIPRGREVRQVRLAPTLISGPLAGSRTQPAVLALHNRPLCSDAPACAPVVLCCKAVRHIHNHPGCLSQNTFSSPVNMNFCIMYILLLLYLFSPLGRLGAL